MIIKKSINYYFSDSYSPLVGIKELNATVPIRFSCISMQRCRFNLQISSKSECTVWKIFCKKRNITISKLFLNALTSTLMLFIVIKLIVSNASSIQYINATCIQRRLYATIFLVNTQNKLFQYFQLELCSLGSW